MPTPEARMRRLVEAGIALTSELSLDALLHRLVEIAAQLTSARSASLELTSPERRIATGDGDLDEEATELAVPVALRGVAYGHLHLRGTEFTDLDVEAAGVLAAQAAVAIENARLFESATRWSAQLQSLNAVSDALVGEFDLMRLLQLVAERVCTLIGVTGVVIALPHGDGARIEAAAGERAAELLGLEIPHRSKTARILERKRSERVDSAADDPEIDAASAARLGLHTGLYVPLVIRGEAIGVITARDKLGPDARFTAEDQRLLELFAQRASIAVELSRRVARDALQRVVTAQEAERRRLARELHDETGQALTSILLGLKTIEDASGEDAKRTAVAHVRELVRETLQDVRRLAVELRPSALDDFGLVPALERLTATFTESTRIPVDVRPALPERLPPEVETALYRIVQEALTNVVKHARATRVRITLTRTAQGVSAVVEDDGVGFESASARAGGLGLVGMRERVGLLGGRLDVEATPGDGTRLSAEIPLA